MKTGPRRRRLVHVGPVGWTINRRKPASIGMDRSEPTPNKPRTNVDNGKYRRENRAYRSGKPGVMRISVRKAHRTRANPLTSDVDSSIMISSIGTTHSTKGRSNV